MCNIAHAAQYCTYRTILRRMCKIDRMAQYCTCCAILFRLLCNIAPTAQYYCTCVAILLCMLRNITSVIINKYLHSMIAQHVWLLHKIVHASQYCARCRLDCELIPSVMNFYLVRERLPVAQYRGKKIW